MYGYRIKSWATINSYGLTLQVDNANLGPEYTVEQDARRRKRQAETSENKPIEIREEPKVDAAREKKRVAVLVKIFK